MINKCRTQRTSNNAFLNGNEYHKPDRDKILWYECYRFSQCIGILKMQNAFSVAKEEDKYYNDATWNVTYVDSHDYAPDTDDRRGKI